MQGHQDSLEAASTRENGLVGPHPLHILGVQKSRRPLRLTGHQALPVAIVSFPYSLQLLPLQCRRERDFAWTLPGRWMSGFHPSRSSV